MNQREKDIYGPIPSNHGDRKSPIRGLSHIYIHTYISIYIYIYIYIYVCVCVNGLRSADQAWFAGVSSHLEFPN